MAIHPVDMAILEAMVNDMVEDHKMIVLARRYHSGAQDVHLDSRMREFLDLHDETTFQLNICKGVINAVRDELTVVGFDTDETPDAEGKKKQAEFAMNVATSNRLDALQGDVHEATLRDRETFVIVDWDAEKKSPRLTHNQRYTDVGADGDGVGCWMVYENDDPNQPARAAVKQWTEIVYDLSGQPSFLTRRTVYYADRIEKWHYDGGWVEHRTEGEDWPIPWVDKKKKPLGIPVIHFKNKGLMPEAWDAIPMQDAVNKALVDVLATGDMGAFSLFVALGFYPTTDGQPVKDDGSNLLPIKPGSWVGSSKSKEQADVKKLDGQDITPMMSALKDLIVLTAQITDTPVSRFVTSGQVAGEGTLKEQEQPLKKKAADRRVLFGNSWEDCMVMARKLANLYGAKLDENVAFTTLWAHSESLDELLQKLELGVPLETIWAEMGYSPAQIKVMKTSPEYKLKIEKLLWEAAKFAVEANAPLEFYLLRNGVKPEEMANIGTQRLAAIKLKQEDRVPPVGQ
jgi:hypothetical protein